MTLAIAAVVPDWKRDRAGHATRTEDAPLRAIVAYFARRSPSRVGRIPLGGGVTQLIRRLPHTQAMGLLLTGRRAGATELRDMGLVNEVAPAGELDAMVDPPALHVATWGGAATLRQLP